MSGHTPGPWVVRHNEFDGFCVHAPTIESQTDCLYRIACNINGDETPNPKYGAPEANARLIAAAPELLDALKSIVSDYEFCKAHPAWGDRGEQYAETARAAIAAATGEQA